jgi:hypothetical protein
LAGFCKAFCEGYEHAGTAQGTARDLTKKWPDQLLGQLEVFDHSRAHGHVHFDV